MKSFGKIIKGGELLVAPVRERGLKFNAISIKRVVIIVAPVRERGLKCRRSIRLRPHYSVAPVRERGLKYLIVIFLVNLWSSRSREGAWIEIVAVDNNKVGFCVAPVRERGLKFNSRRSKQIITSVAPVRERGLKSAGEQQIQSYRRRSREGAWIEIFAKRSIFPNANGRSREGAWIEILNHYYLHDNSNKVAPVRERGLKLAPAIEELKQMHVAPVRERGLKCVRVLRSSNPKPSRSRKGAWIEMALLPNR